MKRVWYVVSRAGSYIKKVCIDNIGAEPHIKKFVELWAESELKVWCR